jgi:ribosomal protein S17E
MNAHILKTIDQYNENEIYFCEPTKNNLMNEGIFTRILYTTPSLTLNGINLLIHLNDTVIEKYYNKFKCSFNPYINKEIVEKIKMVEKSILNQVSITDKRAQFKIGEQLSNNHIKLFSDPLEKNNLYMLKISGIWETDYDYGVTYKFIKVNKIL